MATKFIVNGTGGEQDASARFINEVATLNFQGKIIKIFAPGVVHTNGGKPAGSGDSDLKKSGVF